MRITLVDISVALIGFVLAVVGSEYDIHGISFAGGALCGASFFLMGYKFEEWRMGK